MARAKENAIRAARYALNKKLPYFSRLLWSLSVIETKSIPTAGVDKKWRLFYNPDFIKAMRPKEAAAILLHEINHLIRHHCSRIGVRQPEIWNIAADCEINPALAKDGFKLPEYIAKNTKGEEVKYDPFMYPSNFDLPENLLAEEYYDLLMEKAEKQTCKQCGSTVYSIPMDGSDGQSGGDGQQGEEKENQNSGNSSAQSSKEQDENSSGSGETSSCECCNPSQGGSASDGQERPWEKEHPAGEKWGHGIGEAEGKIIVREFAKDVKKYAKSRGTVPGYLERLVDEILAPPKVDWRKELKGQVRKSINRVRGMVDYAYGRPSRRHQSSKVIFPSMFKPLPNATFIIDTSGSMGSDELLAACSEVQGVMKTLSVPLRILSADADIGNDQKGIRDVNKIELKGGGGTDMRVPLDLLKNQKNNDIVIVITDGYTPWPEQKMPYDTIICYTDKNGMNNAPLWAKNIYIGED